MQLLAALQPTASSQLPVWLPPSSGTRWHPLAPVGTRRHQLAPTGTRHAAAFVNVKNSFNEGEGMSCTFKLADSCHSMLKVNYQKFVELIQGRGPLISWFQNSWSPLFRDLVSGTNFVNSPPFHDFQKI